MPDTGNKVHYGTFTEQQVRYLDQIAQATAERMAQDPDERLIFAGMFNTTVFQNAGHKLQMYRPIGDVDVLGDNLYVMEGDEPVIVDGDYEKYEIGILPKIFVGARITIEAVYTQNLGDAFLENMRRARDAVERKINIEMGNVLLAGCYEHPTERKPQNDFMVPDNSWYSSEDTRAPPKFGLNHWEDAAAHKVEYKYGDDPEDLTTVELTGHIEYTTTPLNLDKLLAVKEHMAHHGNGFGQRLVAYANHKMVRQLLTLAVNDKEKIPEDVYKSWFIAGDVVGSVLNFLVVENEYMPDDVVFVTRPNAKPGRRLLNIPIMVTDLTNPGRGVLSSGIMYRAGYGIEDRGAGYIMYNGDEAQ